MSRWVHKLFTAGKVFINVLLAKDWPLTLPVGPLQCPIYVLYQLSFFYCSCRKSSLLICLANSNGIFPVCSSWVSLSYSLCLQRTSSQKRRKKDQQSSLQSCCPFGLYPPPMTKSPKVLFCFFETVHGPRLGWPLHYIYTCTHAHSHAHKQCPSLMTGGMVGQYPRLQEESLTTTSIS